MEPIIEALRQDWEQLLKLIPRLAYVALLFFVAWLVGKGLGALLERVLRRGQLARAHVSFFRSLCMIASFGFASILGLNLLGFKIAAASLVTGGGVTAVVAAFAFREIGENLLSGFFLAFSRPFETGHLIRSGDFEGSVEGIDLRSTHIRAADGRDIYIPNSQILNTPLVNYTKDGLRRFSCTIGIDYLDDAAKACGLLADATRNVSGVLADPGLVVMVEALSTNTVDLVAHYWVDAFDKARSLANIQTEVRNDCRRALIDAGFTVSSNVAANTALETQKPVLVQMVASS